MGEEKEALGDLKPIPFGDKDHSGSHRCTKFIGHRDTGPYGLCFLLPRVTWCTGPSRWVSSAEDAGLSSEQPRARVLPVWTSVPFVHTAISAGSLAAFTIVIAVLIAAVMSVFSVIAFIFITAPTILLGTTQTDHQAFDFPEIESSGLCPHLKFSAVMQVPDKYLPSIVRACLPEPQETLRGK